MVIALALAVKQCCHVCISSFTVMAQTGKRKETVKIISLKPSRSLQTAMCGAPGSVVLSSEFRWIRRWVFYWYACSVWSGDPSSCCKTHRSVEHNKCKGNKAQVMTEGNDCLCLDITWCRNLRSSGTLCSVERRFLTDVSGQPIEPSS